MVVELVEFKLHGTMSVSFFIIIRPPPELLPVLGLLNGDVMPTLDVPCM